MESWTAIVSLGLPSRVFSVHQVIFGTTEKANHRFEATPRTARVKHSVPGVRRSGSPTCSGRGSACPKRGVGERDQSASPERPSRTSGSFRLVRISASKRLISLVDAAPLPTARQEPRPPLCLPRPKCHGRERPANAGRRSRLRRPPNGRSSALKNPMAVSLGHVLGRSAATTGDGPYFFNGLVDTLS